MTLSLKDFSYDFPDELIARYPSDQREHSRLLILNRSNKKISHKHFSDIVGFFKEGDVLVINNSKVFPCRLITQRKTGGKQEILLIQPLNDNQTHWNVLINASKKVRKGDTFEFKNLKIIINSEQGKEREATLEFSGDLQNILANIAQIPLPPYMQRTAEADDLERYQTVYAKDQGSVAAPTAGLHFTAEIIEQLKSKGVQIAEVTLHVGPGTFLPVRNENITDHKMHTERYCLTKECCQIINQAKAEKRRITAVGTTSTRVLEAVAQQKTRLQPGLGETDIFIYPGFEFKIVDRLITNFHLPESTLLMLVSAFAGQKTILDCYKKAVKERYRLFSYGDSMLIE